MNAPDLITVGLSEEGSVKLDELKELGVFAKQIDGYRFAVSLAIAQGVIPNDIAKRTTLFNVGSLDPEQVLKTAVEALMASQLEECSPYRLIERLADWGVRELYAMSQTSSGIDFIALLGQSGVREN